MRWKKAYDGSSSHTWQKLQVKTIWDKCQSATLPHVETKVVDAKSVWTGNWCQWCGGDLGSYVDIFFTVYPKTTIEETRMMYMLPLTCLVNWIIFSWIDSESYNGLCLMSGSAWWARTSFQWFVVFKSLSSLVNYKAALFGGTFGALQNICCRILEYWST